MDRPRKVLCVVGARPNFMKMAPILEAMRPYGDTLRPVLVHTGQHYDAAMSDVFFDDLDIPAPDRFLSVGSGSHAEQTGRTMMAFERCVAEEAPDLVVVVGDVNSTLACALVAAKAQVPLAHVEAGLRSRDPSMPEETNRRVADLLSDLLFTHCREADENLLGEGIDPSRILFAGNVMIDSVLRWRSRARAPRGFAGAGLPEGGYGLVTLHRPALVDDPSKLVPFVGTLVGLSREVPFLYPVHPRTLGKMREFGLVPEGFEADLSPLPGSRLHLCPPLRYLEFLWVMDRARLVVTDSGGIQEETSALGVPCLTARDNTERGVTLTEGTARLVGTDPAALPRAVAETLSRPRPGPRLPERWDGRAARRIAALLDAWARGEPDLGAVLQRLVTPAATRAAPAPGPTAPGHRPSRPEAPA
ncbi:UDP-N-acetylglucosamine 2-epimerase (non-hydrolyzing) [Myxococcota bacterium]|nr:UDP-N-acetylglucosamine 2-epimerase (non-hydrolyzing) [Myxococcota bacterium]